MKTEMRIFQQKQNLFYDFYYFVQIIMYQLFSIKEALLLFR